MTTVEAALLRTTCSALAAQPWLIRKRASKQLKPMHLLARDIFPPVQAFLMTTEGAVLRRAARGAPAAAPWLVYKRGGWGGGFKLIGRLPRRPNAQARRTS